MGNPDGDTVVLDQGGGYRTVMQEIIEELEAGEQIKAIVKCPTMAEGSTSQRFMLNEHSPEDEDDTFICIGAFLAFSFMTRQPFGLELSKAVWKQIVGDKIERKEIYEIDPRFYQALDYRFPLPVGKLEDGTVVKLPLQGEDLIKYDEEVEKYFDKFRRQVEAIRKGMSHVLDGKLDVIAYLPVEEIMARVEGQSSYTADQLRSITKTEYYDGLKDEDGDKVKDWFFKAIDEFTDEERSQYLKFVSGKSRLPSNLKSVTHIFTLLKQQEKKEPPVYDTKQGVGKDVKIIIPERIYYLYKIDGIPTSHTCSFQFECPLYSCYEKMRDQLKVAITLASGLAD